MAQFVWCYLYRIPSEINLSAYERGLERTPFQYRLLLMWPLRWADHCLWLHGLAARLSALPAWFPRGVRPEGIVQAAVDWASVCVSCGAATALYKRCSRLHLLPWLVNPLLLCLCFVTYIGLAHHSLRFMYDLPSMAFFSAALYLIHASRWNARSIGLFAVVFMIGTLNRETTLLLLAFLILAEWRKKGPSQRSIALAAPLLCYWICFHLWTAHRFAGNVNLSTPHLLVNVGSLLIPLSWPQLAAALGYLWLPLIVYRHFLWDPILRRWLHGLWIWLGFMLFFGLLVEIRLFGELLPYTACAIALIAEEKLSAFMKSREVRADVTSEPAMQTAAMAAANTD